MKTWIIAAAACLPAIALATPITSGTSTSTSTSKSASAAAKPAKNAGGGSQGSATAADVTLDGIPASALFYSASINPQQGPNGNTSGFAGAYAASGSGDWANLAKFAGNAKASNAKLAGLALTMAFSLTDLRHGTWSISNTDTANDLSFDLAFAMHTGGGSGSWLFDNYLLEAGSTAKGSWSLNLLNAGGQTGAYSNLTLFVRNATAMALPATPAPIVQPAPAPSEAELEAAATPQPVLSSPAPIEYVFEIPLAELIAAVHDNDDKGGKALLEASADPLTGTGAGGAAAESGTAAGSVAGSAAPVGVVPEPGSLAVFLTGAGLLAATRRRQAVRKASSTPA